MQQLFKCLRCGGRHTWNDNITESDTPIFDQVRQALCRDCKTCVEGKMDYHEIYDLYSAIFRIDR